MLAISPAVAGVQGPQGGFHGYGLAGLAGLGAAGFPARTTGSARVYNKPGGGTVVTTLAANTRVNVTAIQGMWSQTSQGWIESRLLVDDPNAISSDGVQMLQASLNDLAAFGFPQVATTETNGVIGPATVRAVANSLSIVSGDIKGGKKTTDIIAAALNVALISDKVDQMAQTYVRQYAKPLAVAIQIYVARKRGQQMPSEGGFLPGMTSGWNPTTLALAGLGAIVVLGGLYIVFKK